MYTNASLKMEIVTYICSLAFIKALTLLCWSGRPFLGELVQTASICYLSALFGSVEPS